MELYYQCTLVKHSRQFAYEEVAYIPAQFASVGRVVRIKRNDGLWDDGWRVVKVGAAREKRDLPDTHKALRRHRKETGDALPRARATG